LAAQIRNIDAVYSSDTGRVYETAHLKSPSARRSQAGGCWFDPSRAHGLIKPFLASCQGCGIANGE
jgi:hypothetical protein